MPGKIVIIGIDGAPFELINDLTNRNVMPNFAQLKSLGIFTKMRSAIPEISSVAWSSIITGRNPGEHGIFGFIELMPNSYTLRFPDFRDLRQPAFWHRQNKKKYIIINVPSTYPVRPLNGIHISGFISPDLKEAVMPVHFLDKLQEFNYEIDVDSQIAHESKQLFLENLFRTHSARAKAIKYFWQNEPWDVFMLVFTGSDRLEHFLWDAYEDQNSRYHNAFLDYFRQVDHVVGEIASDLSDNDMLLILSDHGMTRIKENFFVNAFLAENGFLFLDKNQRGYNQIKAESKAFALDPGRIFIHRKEKFPRGCVLAGEVETIKKALIDAFAKLKRNDESIIKRIFQREEIYYGEEVEQAADLILISEPGYRLRGSIHFNNLFTKDVFTGDHTLENAFLYFRYSKAPEIMPLVPTVEDAGKIIEAAINL